MWPSDQPLSTDADFLPANITDIGLGRPASEEVCVIEAKHKELF